MQVAIALLVTSFLPALLCVSARAGETPTGARQVALDDRRITALAIDPQTPTTLYATSACGVFQSTDGGRSWRDDVNGGPPDLVYAGPLVIDPQSPTTLYAAAGRAVFKSTTAGRWSAASTGLPVGDSLIALAIDPLVPSTLYAGTWGGGSSSGVFKSTNGGGTWNAVNTGLPNFAQGSIGQVKAVVIGPRTPTTTTLYAGTALCSGRECALGGVFRSTNGAATWQATGLTRMDISTLAVDPLTTGTLYAAPFEQDVSKSTDAGASWLPLGIGLARNTTVSAIAIDPQTPTTLYVGTGYCTESCGVFKSTDGGMTWRVINTNFGGYPINALAIDPQTPSTLYVTTDGGGMKSVDGGASWSALGVVSVICGDDVVNVGCGEQCDDGNTVSGDGCDANCTPTACGNGVLTVGEQCDDGSRFSCDGCSATCQTEAGFICGDGLVSAACGEQCDDGNPTSCDGCSASCRFEAGVVCGDGAVNPACEQCDDGNILSCDGCSATCRREVGFTCGDGLVSEACAEQCDDRNRIDGDGCDSNCTVTRCGNGIVSGGEQCDDGNGMPYDGCTTVCTLCGDGVVTPPEQCDDGNTNASDGCTNACTLCGDGSVATPEGCDDGNLVDGDGCNSDCIRPGCGNAVSEGDEECDDGGICIGSTNAGTLCTDSVQCRGGACETFGGDGCAANCTLESDVAFTFVRGAFNGTVRVPGTSGAVIHGDILTIPIPLAGSGVLTIGKQRDGQIPVVAKAGAIDIPRSPVSSIACECPRPIAAKTCGGTFFEADGRTLSADCTPGYTAGNSVCAGKKPCAFLHGPGNSTSGAIGCGGLDGINVRMTQDAGGEAGAPGPPMLTACRSSGPGSAVFLNSGAIGVVIGQCTGTIPETYGPDGEFCTDDDPQSVRGIVFTNPLVTGRATAVVVGANDIDGNDIGPFSVAGAPFNCGALTASPPSAAGAALVSAFVQLDRPTVGDVVFTTVLVVPGTARPPEVVPLVGDCNGSDEVTVEEIITMVNVALGNIIVDVCPRGDGNSDGQISVDEIVTAASNALNGCV